MSTATEKKEDFSMRSKAIKDSIKIALDKEKVDASTLKSATEDIEYKKLLLADHMIYIATLYMAINTLSVEVLNFKNNDALNDARKSIYKALIYLEEVVSNVIDCPYTDMVPKLEKIANLSIEKRFYLVRKLGLVIKLLTDAFGDNSKWKWTFVEIRGRFVVVAKNLMDMKQAAKDYFDHESADYENTVLYVRLIKKLLDASAMDYHNKYELGSRRIDDMRSGINFLIAYRRVAMALGDSELSEEIRKKALVWKNKLDADTKSGASK